MKDGVFSDAEQKTLAFPHIFVTLDQGFLIYIHDNAEPIHYFITAALGMQKQAFKAKYYYLCN
jgi:hypothetical protein